MSNPKRKSTQKRGFRSVFLASVLGVVVIGGGLNTPAVGAQDRQTQYKRPISFDDPRFATLKKAAAEWDKRKGPKRQVVDVVCLVENLPGFFEAIAFWDESTYFPILFDDPEYSRKFIHAFVPSRVFRIPKKPPIDDKQALWNAALAAIGRSWSSEKDGSARLKGDEIPKLLGATPPGVVISHPESTSLAGAIALAAGRFQPLLRWETKRHFADVLQTDEAGLLTLEIEKEIAKIAPNYAAWGDDCDFATLAGDYPYRYNAPEKMTFRAGIAAFDDLVGRSHDADMKRWAFTGRLLGDPASSSYRAMCALFLQPKYALCFNGYPEQDPSFMPYNTMIGARRRLDPIARTTLRSGTKKADLVSWHAMFDPQNRYGLLMITSHGAFTVFNIIGGAGRAADVPATNPTIVFMIHSFSAAEPLNGDTIAGRWLDNGRIFTSDRSTNLFSNRFERRRSWPT